MEATINGLFNKIFIYLQSIDYNYIISNTYQVISRNILYYYNVYVFPYINNFDYSNFF